MVHRIRARDKGESDADVFQSQEPRRGLVRVWGRLKPDEPDDQGVAQMLPVDLPQPPAPEPAPRPLGLRRPEFDGATFALDEAFDWMNEYGGAAGFARRWQEWEPDALRFRRAAAQRGAATAYP